MKQKKEHIKNKFIGNQPNSVIINSFFSKAPVQKIQTRAGMTAQITII